MTLKGSKLRIIWKLFRMQRKDKEKEIKYLWKAKNDY